MQPAYSAFVIDDTYRNQGSQQPEPPAHDAYDSKSTITVFQRSAPSQTVHTQQLEKIADTTVWR